MTNIEGGEFIGPKLLSEKDTMERMREIDKRNLRYTQYYEDAQLTDEQFQEWGQLRNELAALAVTSISRIRSGEFTTLDVKSRPGSSYFQVELFGGGRSVGISVDAASQFDPEISQKLEGFRPGESPTPSSQ